MRDRFDQWLNGGAAALGYELMEPLAPPAQVRRVMAVLNACRRFWAPVPEVDAIATAAADPRRWAEGHRLFRDVRVLTSNEERARTDEVYRALLDVAEIAAKTVYNASGEPAPFDRDAPWAIASCALAFAKAMGTDEAHAEVWRALIHSDM